MTFVSSLDVMPGVYISRLYLSSAGVAGNLKSLKG